MKLSKNLLLFGSKKKYVYNEIKQKNIIMSLEQRDNDDFYDDLYDKNDDNHLKSDDFYVQGKSNSNEEKSRKLSILLIRWLNIIIIIFLNYNCIIIIVIIKPKI